MCLCAFATSLTKAQSGNLGLSPAPSVDGSNLQVTIIRPTNAEQLLLNLKEAWTQHWLLQPAFYDESNLLKFFDGTAINWGPHSGLRQVPADGEVNLALPWRTFSKLEIQVIRRAPKRAPDGTAAPRAYGDSWMCISGQYRA